MSDVRQGIIDEILQLSGPDGAAADNLRRAYERYDLDDLRTHLEHLRAGRAVLRDAAPQNGEQRGSLPADDSAASSRSVGLVERMAQVNKTRDPREPSRPPAPAPAPASAAAPQPAPSIARPQAETRPPQHGKPTLIIVGADKGGVGKTTVSRTLLDYFSARNVQVRAFDTEVPEGDAAPVPP